MNLRGTLSALWVAALALALLLGAWLRLSGLGQQSLWADELFSADLILNRALQPAPGQPWLRHVPFAELQPGDTFWTVKGADQSPPLFELAAKLCVRLLGDGEAALRVASALPAVLALLWLAWGAWQRRAAAAGVAWAALLGLTASSWLLAAYAQEARAYSLGAALLLPLIVRFAQRAAGGWTHAAPPGWGEALLAAAACLTHYNAAAVVVLLWAVYGAARCSGAGATGCGAAGAGRLAVGGTGGLCRCAPGRDWLDCPLGLGAGAGAAGARTGRQCTGLASRRSIGGCVRAGAGRMGLAGSGGTPRALPCASSAAARTWARAAGAAGAGAGGLCAAGAHHRSQPHLERAAPDFFVARFICRHRCGVGAFSSALANISVDIGGDAVRGAIAHAAPLADRKK